MSRNKRCYRQIAAVISLASSHYTLAQSTVVSSAKSIALSESASTSTNMPKSRSTTANQCDQQQSIYSLVKPRSGTHDVVISMARDGQSEHVYTLSPTLDGEPGTVAFSVAPNGAVDLLDQLPDKGTYLQRYDERGRAVTPTRIALPSSRLNVSQIAVNNSGNFLISGIYGNEEPAPRTSVPFIAVFDSDGQHYREVTEIDRGLLVTDIQNSLVEQALTADEYGAFYLQVRNRIFVIGDSGHLLRTLTLSDWPAGSFTHILKISGNKILVGYLTLDEIKTRMLHLHLDLYDLATGAIIATYDPSAISDIFGCFDSQKGFTFLKVRQGTLFFVDATLP